MRLARACIATSLIVALTLAGCTNDPHSGYSFEGVHDANLGPIAVPVWDNTTFTHGLEVPLTDAIVKEIQRASPWKVVGRDRARSVLTGTITSVELRRLSTANISGIVEDVAVEVTVDYEWRQAGTGKVLMAKRGVRSVSEFVPSKGVGERVEVGQQQALQAAARDVVASLRSGW